MRILHITSGLGAGGAERSLLQLVRACDPAQRSDDSDVDTDSAADPVVMRVASLTSADELADQFPSSPAVFDLKVGRFGAVRRLVEYARDCRPDLIQGWMYHGNLVASYVGWRLGVPVIWSIRHSLEQPKAETWAVRLAIGLGRMACFQPKRVVYNSVLGWSTHARAGYGTKPSMIIPNGVDINYFSTSPSSALVSLQSSEGSSRPTLTDSHHSTLPVLGCVARFHPMKGITTLLEAHAAIQSEQPCQLLLAGSGMTQTNPELAEMIANVGYGERVTLLGLVDDVATLYAQFSVLVLSSHYGEGTPNVLLEAMASNVPVVATRVGDASRCVGSEEWLVEPGDAQQLRKRLLAMLTLSASQRTALIVSNKQHVKQNYSLDVCHARYVQLYKHLHQCVARRSNTGVTL